MKVKIIVGTIFATVILFGGGLFAVSRVQAQTDENITILQRVAQILGIEEEELDSAFRQAQKEEVDEQVEEGQLDEEKSEKIKERIDDAESPLWGYKFGMKRHFLRMHKGGLLGEFLGITEEEVMEQLQDGKTIDDLLEDYGKTREELHEYMEENRPEMHHFGQNEEIPIPEPEGDASNTTVAI